MSVSHEFTVNRSSLDHCEWRFGCKWIESGPLSKHCHDYFHFFFYFIGLSHSEDILTSQSREGTDVINKNTIAGVHLAASGSFFHTGSLSLS